MRRLNSVFVSVRWREAVKEIAFFASRAIIKASSFHPKSLDRKQKKVSKKKIEKTASSSPSFGWRSPAKNCGRKSLEHVEKFQEATKNERPAAVRRFGGPRNRPKVPSNEGPTELVFQGRSNRSIQASSFFRTLRIFQCPNLRRDGILLLLLTLENVYEW